MFPSMPTCALERVPDALVAPLDGIPDLLMKLLAEQLESEALAPVSPDALAESETRLSELDMSELEKEFHPGKPSEFGCPECGGVLWEIDQSGLMRFRCRVGHAYTALHLRAEQRHAVETALWAALRALEESVSLYRRIADRARDTHHGHSVRIFEERAVNAEANVRTLRDFLLHVGSPSAEADEAA
jgi:two-component system chemotaxis response regulator CheB